ncbi:MAG: MBL fold metallo-hydrolase [Gammaproteobacteria bacterium]
MNLRKILLVDDDPVTGRLLEPLFGEQGGQILHAASGAAALERLEIDRPDLIIMDLSDQELDGCRVCRDIRAIPDFDHTPIIIHAREGDGTLARNALAAGANAFIAKPVEASAFLDTVGQLLADRVELILWGVRGTMPVPGPNSLRFGGNTPCVSLCFPNKRFLIFDAGTGIRALDRSLRSIDKRRMAASIFISHPHWDHINALPLFDPLYEKGNQFDIYGAAQGTQDIHQLISAQMDGVYFPVTVHAFGADVAFHTIHEQTVDLDGIRISSMLLNHPGNCLGYRVDYEGRSICYITDNELYPEDLEQHDPDYVERLARFVGGADILITDTTYTDTEYREHINWGHSSVGEVVKLAHKAKVGKLFLFHHDPDQTDRDIANKLYTAREQLAALGSDTQVIAPVESVRFQV